MNWNHKRRTGPWRGHLCTACVTVSLMLQAFPAAQVMSDARSPTTGFQAIALPARLQPGDLIELQVMDTPQLSGRVRIAADGTIGLPVIGQVPVAGLTPLEASAAVEERLRERRVMLRPQAAMLVIEYAVQQITVIGEVNQPGNYPVIGRQSLYNALAAAGGVTQRQGSSITITRSGSVETTTIAVSSPDYSEAQHRTLVGPGDLIVVSRAPSIYVVGDVGRPGEFPIQKGLQLSTLKAIALAAGLNRTASASKASIVRRTPDGAATIPVNLDLVSKNRAVDPVLMPDDVLVIPRSGVKTFVELTLPGATSAVITSVGTALVFR